MDLIWYIVKNDIDSVRMMLQSGIDVNVTYLWNSKDTYSPVSAKTPKKIKIDQEYQCLALNIAVLGGRYEMTRLLLSAGANINKKDGRGRTALICAIYGLDLDDSHLNSSNLAFISKTNPIHLDIIKNILLIDPNLDSKTLDSPQLEIKGITLLCLASYLCKKEIVHILLNDGRIHVNGTDSKNATALMYAARDGNVSIARLLLEYQASPDIIDSHGWSSIQFADRNSNIIKLCEEQLRIKRLDLIPYYKAKNAAFNKIKLTKIRKSIDTPVMHVTQTAFVQAIKTHDYIALQDLLDKVLVNYHDPKTGMTALHHAIRTKQSPSLDTITILYQAGADVNAQTYYGRTCLHHLARFGTNPDGTWGIQRSKNNGSVSKSHIKLDNIHRHLGQCASLLLQFGALVNIADPTGNTPLHFAAEFGGVPEVLEVLILEGNADLNWKNKKGATPLDVCKSEELRKRMMEFSIKQKQKCRSILSSSTIDPSDSISLISVNPQFLSNQDDFAVIQKNFFNYQTIMADDIEALLGVLTDYFLKPISISIEDAVTKLRFELKSASSIFEKMDHHIDNVMYRFYEQLEYFDEGHRSDIDLCQSHQSEMEKLFQVIDQLDGQLCHLEQDLENAICQVQVLRTTAKQKNGSIAISHCVYQLTQTLNLLELIPPDLLHGQPCKDSIFDQLGYEITRYQQNENDPSYLQLFNEQRATLYERWSTIRTTQLNNVKEPVKISYLKHSRSTVQDLDQLELSFDILHSNLCEIQKDIEETTERSEAIAKQKRQMYDICLGLERELVSPRRLETDIQSDLTHLLTYTQQLFEEQEQLDNDREQLKKEQAEILKQIEKIENKLSKASRTSSTRIRRAETSKINHNKNIEKNDLTGDQLKQLEVQCQSPISHLCYTTRLDTSLYCLKSIANEWITRSRFHLVDIYSTLNQASVELEELKKHTLLLYENSVEVLKQVIMLKKELEMIVTHRKEEVAKVWEILDDVSASIRFKNVGTNCNDDPPKTSSPEIRVEELDRHRWIICELEQLQHVYDQLQYSIDNLKREQSNLDKRIKMFGVSLIDPQKNTLFGEGSVTYMCGKLSELLTQVKHANFGLIPVSLKDENKRTLLAVSDKSLKCQKREKLSVDTSRLPITTNYTSPYTSSSVRQRRVSTEISIMTDSKRMSAVSARSLSSLSCYQQERMMTKVTNLHNTLSNVSRKMASK